MNSDYLADSDCLMDTSCSYLLIYRNNASSQFCEAFESADALLKAYQRLSAYLEGPYGPDEEKWLAFHSFNMGIIKWKSPEQMKSYCEGTL